jgi:hypothetical protein
MARWKGGMSAKEGKEAWGKYVNCPNESDGGKKPLITVEK